MVDRPIIFSAPMVRALLEGRKTQTRRLIKRGWARQMLDAGMTLDFVNDPGNASGMPFQPGDRLWVREACRASQSGSEAAVEYRAAQDEEFGDARVIENSEAAASDWCRLYAYRGAGRDGVGAWVPAIHMPRWTSRLTLTVTEVRVERLWEISYADAAAEGILREGPTPLVPGSAGDVWHNGVTDPLDGWTRSPRTAFADLWNAIHGPGAWEANPEVVALTFDVRRGSADA